MLKKLNHVAIAVSNLSEAAKDWEARLGVKVSPPEALPEHGVSVVFIETGTSKIELLEPLGDDSPIASFLERNPDGGIHHLCFEVADIIETRDILVKEGARILGDGEPKIGAHGKRVLFLHPKDWNGTLIELEEE